METELTYKTRNARGIYSFGTYLGGTGQINLVNGNLMFKRQIVSRPGRAGFNLDLSIYYNSKIWDRNANGMYVKDTGSWVGIGWYLGFARLVQGTATCAIIPPTAPLMRSSNMTAVSGSRSIRPTFFWMFPPRQPRLKAEPR
jgi:hypothetical protein